jgi:lipid II:glycine glycyltransferase (peptidoglycan interpeptide bridge formation enzyme)
VATGGAELLPEFFDIMSQAWRNLGTPLYSREYFAEILARFQGDVRIFMCRRDGRAVGTALNGYFRDTVEGLWNGLSAEGRALGSNYVLYWEMIRDASIRGYRSFHLGRSTAGSSAIDFKLKWNAEQRQLHWYYWTPAGRNLPELNVDNPRFGLAIALWRRLPVRLTRILGPPLARCIP